MSLQLENPAIFGLRELYNASPEARQILHHFSGWKEDRKVTGVKRVHRMLQRDGSLIQRPQIEQFFQSLHAAGLGEFISGEGVRKPRFVWTYPLRKLALVATGEAWELEPLPLDPNPTESAQADADENGDAEEVLDSGDPIGMETARMEMAGAGTAGMEMPGTETAATEMAGTEPTRKTRTIKHSFRLREDRSVKFRLPRDLTMSEAVRLAEYIKTLPFGG